MLKKKNLDDRCCSYRYMYICNCVYVFMCVLCDDCMGIEIKDYVIIIFFGVYFIYYYIRCWFKVEFFKGVVILFFLVDM